MKLLLNLSTRLAQFKQSAPFKKRTLNGLKLSLIILLLSFLGLVAGGGYLIHKSQGVLNTKLNIEAQYFEIKAGQSFNRLISQLVHKSWLETDWQLKLQARLNPSITHIKAGVYHLSGEITLADLLVKFTQGDVAQFKITFIEGTHFKQWQAQLAEHPWITQTNYQTQLTDLIQPYERVEGLLFPDTYFFNANTTDFDIIKQAYKSMENIQLDYDLSQQALDWYQLLTLASIIEKETAMVSEMPTISSVFYNRLNKNMRLQTDPTVIYGLGERYQGDILSSHLTEYTPYNTYKIKGLPPTPIAMPSKAAIEAALNPAQTNYFYFVANGQGGHTFSVNLKQHNQAVKAYLKWLKRQN